MPIIAWLEPDGDSLPSHSHGIMNRSFAATSRRSEVYEKGRLP